MATKNTYLNKHFHNAGIAIALLILFAIGIITYRFFQLRNEYSNWVVHSYLVVDNLQTLLTHIVDAETGQRGFIITGKNKLLEPYNDALEHLDSQMQKLKELTIDNPSQEKLLDSIQVLIDHRLAGLKRNIELRKREGLDSVARKISEGTGEAIMDSIRTKVARAQNQEFSLLNERTRGYNTYSHLLNAILITGSITAFLILLVIIYFLKHENSIRTRVEKELRVYQEHLNALVEERTGELKASEQRWATTLASLADAVIITDEAGHIDFMNTIAESITGQKLKDAIHKQLSEAFNIMSRERLQPLDDPVLRVLKEGVVSDLFDKVILERKDGKEIPIDGNGARILQGDGTLTGVVFVFRDITKQRQGEDALRNQAALLNFAHDAIFVRNTEDKITFWSRGAEETYGWAPEEATGRDINDLLKTRFSTPLEEINKEARNAGEWNGELFHSRKDGREIVVASRWALQRDIWGRHVTTLEINRDITERKKNERQVFRKNKIVQYVKDILTESVSTQSDEKFGERCLELAISLTGSEYGFIGEIGSDGYLHDIAISGMGWEGCAMYDKTGHRRPPGNFVIHGLYGRVLDFGKSFFTNEPSVHPDHIGIPSGHPPLVNFLGVPFVQHGKMIGITALANKEGGYTKEDVEDLEALAPSIVEGLLRKRAERALRESEAKFKRVFDSNLLAIAFWRSDGSLTDANEALCSILGCTREEVLSGKVSWINQTPHEIVWRDQLGMDEIKEKGVCTSYEKIFIHRDGHRVPVLIGGASIGDKDQGVAYIVDLTKQKEYEKSLKDAQRIAELRAKEAEEGKRLLNALMENVPEGISISDDKGNIIMASKYGRNLLGGFHAGLSIHDVVSTWTVFRPDGKTVMPVEELPLVRALKDETVRDIEIVEMNSAGRKLPLLCNAAPIHDDGKVVNGIVVWRDVTAIKEAMKAVQESESRLRLAQQVAKIGSFEYDILNDVSKWSPEMEALHGLGPGEYSGRYEQWKSFVYKDDLPAVEQILSKAMETGQFETEWRIVRSDGAFRWMAVRGQVFMDNIGRPVRMVGVNLDITERKEAEQELRESEARFRLLADSLPQLVWMLDADGYTEYINQRFYDYTGAGISETSREKWAQLIHPDDVQRTLDLWHHCAQTGELYTIEYRIKKGDDSEYRWFLTRALPVRDKNGNILHWFGTATDIHTQKQLLEDLRVSEERLRFAQQVAKIGSFEWSAKTNENVWTPEMEAMHGLAPGEFGKTEVAWAELVHPEDRSAIYDLVDLTFQTGEPVSGEWRVIWPDGNIHWLNGRFQGFKDENGKRSRLIGVNIDITERKQAEEALQRYTEELAASNRDLESFSYSVSHDLRNPLHTIGSFAEFLMEDYTDRLDEEAQNYLKRIDSGVKKMQSLINDMLNLSRIGRQEMKRVDVDLSVIVRDYLKELEGSEPNRKAEIVVQDTVHANADPRLIHLALENLLRNAWKFTSRKEVTCIEFGTATSTSLGDRPLPNLWPSGAEDQTVYFVKDNGAGFDTKFAEKIFEPFKRVHAEKEFGGTGVGLSIVQRVVERHGGKVWAEGETGKGATFYFTLG